MAAVDRDILTIVEPTIELDQVFVEDTQSVDAQKEDSTANPDPTANQQTVEGGLYPMVQIGTNKVSMEDMLHMEIQNEAFIPTATFVVADSMEKLSAIEYPLDGDVVSLYLKPRPVDEYRPIRIDWDISVISSVPGVPAEPAADDEPLPEEGGESAGEKGKPAEYTFRCVMRVPLLYADIVQGFEEGNSFDHMMECAEGLGLGFASNEDGTDDPMIRVCADTDRQEFIKESTLSAYKNDESFFTSYIDLHYYLCMVNINKQFSMEDVMEDITVVQQEDFDLQSNTEPGDKTPGSLRLSNGQDVSGTNMSISTHVLKNKAGTVWMENGYSRKLKYLNLNENNQDAGGATAGLEQFLITPLNTPGAEEDRIPLRGRPNDPAEMWKDNAKAKYLGKQPSEDFGNVHPNYMYAIANNFGNMDEIEKMSMEVELEEVNWALYRYQRIPIIIYNKGEQTNKTLENRDRQLGEDVQPPLDETQQEGDADVNYEEPATEVKNEFLSGFYVISKIEYKYNKDDMKIKQKLELLRREWPIPARNKDN